MLAKEGFGRHAVDPPGGCIGEHDAGVGVELGDEHGDVVRKGAHALLGLTQLARAALQRDGHGIKAALEGAEFVLGRAAEQRHLLAALEGLGGLREHGQRPQHAAHTNAGQHDQQHAESDHRRHGDLLVHVLREPARVAGVA